MKTFAGLGWLLCHLSLSFAEVSFSEPAKLNDSLAISRHPALAADGHGHWLAAWEVRPEVNGRLQDLDVLFSISTDDGQQWSAPRLLHEANNYDDARPSLAINARGEWLAAYDPMALSRCADPGTSWTAPLFLGVLDQIYSGGFRLTANAQGHCALLSRGVITDAHHQEVPQQILFSRSLDQGDTWTTPISIARPLTSNYEINSDQALAMDDQDNLVAVWLNVIQPPVVWGDPPTTVTQDAPRLHGTHSHDGGATWSPAAVIIDEPKTAQLRPDLATDGKGRWGVLYLNHSAAVSPYSICFASSSDGEHWSAPGVVAEGWSSMPPDDFYPRLAADGHGAWLAVWPGGGAYSLNDGMAWTRIENLHPGSAPAVATDKNGRWAVIWTAPHSGTSDTTVVYISFSDSIKNCANLKQWPIYQ